MPAQALVISKTIALVKPKCCRSLMEVFGSNAIVPTSSYLEILQQIKRSMCAGLYFDFARQAIIAFFARSIENSFCPATRRCLIPVIFSKGNWILFLQPFNISLVETDCDGR